MTILGIDYGTKRVGVAVSDTSEVLAFPKEVVSNDKRLVENIKDLCARENARIVILGHSQDSRGKDNPVMVHIRSFKEMLEKEIGIPVVFEQEFWSSVEAGRFTGVTEDLDASAAAIILQRFLDKQRAA